MPTTNSDNICDSADTPTGTEYHINNGGNNFLTKNRNLCFATEPMPRAADTAAGEKFLNLVRQTHRTQRSPSLAGTGSHPGPMTAPQTLPPPCTQTPTRVIRLSLLDVMREVPQPLLPLRLSPLDVMRSGPRGMPLPDPIAATEPIASHGRFAHIHRVMEHAMMETTAMLLNELPVGWGQLIDSEGMYLAALDVLPYCPQATCGLGDRWDMVYFSSYRELNNHIELAHPEVDTTYQPSKAEYHALLRLLGF